MNLKKTIIVVTMMAFSHRGFGQVKDEALLNKFVNSVATNISYPSDLVTLCKPTYTFMKISIDNECKVDQMLISDSADKLLTLEFLSKQKNFDKVSLEQYLKNNDMKNTNIIIPLLFTFDRYTCPITSMPMSTLDKLTSYFNIPFKDKPAIFLQQITFTAGSTK